MSTVKLKDGVIISDYGRPYIVAEVNSSHNGNKETAKKMIDAAAKAGCDCVKFQSWSSKTLYSKSYYDANPIAKRFVDKFSFSPQDLKEMALYSKERGIAFSSTPYSVEEVDFLANECDVPFIKISSMEINNPEYLKYIANKGLPVIMSTGMSDIDEIDYAVKTIEDTGNKQLILLHCVSIYPTDIQTVNLNNILGLRKHYPNYPIGFSDHTLGDMSAIAAVALGAAVIEKHITLDHTKVGMDNAMAMEPQELEQMVTKCRETAMSLGSLERKVLPDEYAQRSNMRRSIVATHDLEVGHMIAIEDLDVKRPGTGISPNQINCLIGRKVMKAVEADTIIRESDLDNI